MGYVQAFKVQKLIGVNALIRRSIVYLASLGLSRCFKKLLPEHQEIPAIVKTDRLQPGTAEYGFHFSGKFSTLPEVRQQNRNTARTQSHSSCLAATCQHSGVYYLLI